MQEDREDCCVEQVFSECGALEELLLALLIQKAAPETWDSAAE